MQEGTHNMIIAIGDDFLEPAILSAPKEARDYMDGSWCCDNGFEPERLPKEPGVYSCEVDAYWYIDEMCFRVLNYQRVLSYEEGLLVFGKGE